MKAYTTLIITGMITCMTLCVSAQNPGGKGKGNGKGKAKAIAKFDADGDGKLNDAEKANLRAAIQAKRGGKGGGRGSNGNGGGLGRNGAGGKGQGGPKGGNMQRRKRNQSKRNAD